MQVTTSASKQQHQQQKKQCWVGVDGTRTGWVAFILQNDDNYHLYHIKKLQSLDLLFSQFNLTINAIAIDIPIGLLEVAEKGGRGCDRQGRRLLSSAKRNAKKSQIEANMNGDDIALVGSSSIFSPPCRKALNIAFNNNKAADACCCTHAQVSAANKSSSGIGSKDDDSAGLGLSIQTFHILPKIKEADDFVYASTSSDSGHALAFKQKIPVLESHPELAFLSLTLNTEEDALERAKAIYSKKLIQGRRQRLELLCKKARLDASKLIILAGGVTGIMESSLEKLSQMRTWQIASLSDPNGDKVSVAADDVLDAMVCASTSKRWSLNQAKAINEKGSILYDNRRLPMIIWA